VAAGWRLYSSNSYELKIHWRYILYFHARRFAWCGLAVVLVYTVDLRVGINPTEKKLFPADTSSAFLLPWNDPIPSLSAILVVACLLQTIDSTVRHSRPYHSLLLQPYSSIYPTWASMHFFIVAGFSKRDLPCPWPRSFAIDAHTRHWTSRAISCTRPERHTP